jgi:NitT/TauT family transport system substrate-binding protein
MRQKMRYALIILGLCSIFTCTTCTNPAPTVFRVGYNNWPGYELIWLADKLGYFQEAGVHVEHVQFVSLTDAKRAYERGQVDAVGVTAIELLQIAANTRVVPAKVVMVLDISNGADQVLAMPTIAQLSDIKGKRFAVEADSVSVQLAASLIKKSGLTQQDINWVIMQPAQMPEAMQAGKIDLAATYSPYSIEIQHKTPAKVLFSSTDIPNTIVDLLAINRDQLQAHPKEWQALLSALAKSIDYYHAHPQQAVQIMAEHAGMSVDEMTQTFAGLIIPDNTQQSALLMPTGQVINGIHYVQPLLTQLGTPVKNVAIEGLVDRSWQITP